MSEVQEKAPRKLSVIARAIKALGDEYQVEPDCSTDEGYKDAKTKATFLRSLRQEVDGAHKIEKADALALCNKYDKQKRELTEIVKSRENVYKEAYKAIDNEAARVKQAAIDAENERKAAIQAQFDKLTDLEMSSHELPDVIAAIDSLENVSLQDFPDRQEEAEALVEKLLDVLNRRRERLEKAEAEAVKLKAEREAMEAEQEKLRQAREASERRQQELDEREHQLNLKAEREAAAEQERADAAAKAERERIEAEQKAEKDKQDADDKARKEEQAKVKADRKRAVNAKAEAKRIAALAPDAIKLRTWYESIPELPEVDDKSDDGFEARRSLAEMLERIDDITSLLVEQTQEAA